MWSGRPEWKEGSRLCSVRVVVVRSSYVLIVRLDGLHLLRFLGGVLLLLMWTFRRDFDDDDDLLVKL